MKRKILSLVMSVMLLLTTVLGFAACGENYTYPENPGFSARAVMTWNSGSPSSWNLECVHDPVIIEDNGTFYVYGTDNYGDFGYQIRKSTDLVDWKYVGVAIPGFGRNLAEVKANNAKEDGPLHEVYRWISNNNRFDCATLWAPEVYPSKNGGFDLYGSWTTCFGSPRSIIFMCHADKPEGPYTYVDTIVASGASNSNAIDASVFTDAEGKLWLSYGSFSKGFSMIELNPETGLRMDGAGFDEICTTTDETGSVTLLPNGNPSYAGVLYKSVSGTEGSVINYHKDVSVYTGDIAKEKEDASKWTTKDYYYLMGSKDSLSTTYNMRSWKSEKPTADYSAIGARGNKVSGSFSWKSSERDQTIAYDYYCPGHNDMLTLSSGTSIIAYHNRVKFNTNNHSLFLSMYDFNSNGDLVISPNRYAGESVRTVTAKELTNVPGSKGKFDMVEISSSTDPVYCTTGVQFKSNGTWSSKEYPNGTWKMYGDHYIYLACGELEWYGCVFPAWIEKKGSDGAAHGGLTISAISNDGYAIYFNSAF